MAAARLTALLEGDHEKRSAAFGELTALANGDDVDATTNLSTASVHVGGLDGELEDEEKLAEMFGRFGTVLAVTLRTQNEVQHGEQVVSWSLLTFAEEEEARKAVAGAEELGGALVVRSLDTQQALGSSGAMGQVMRTHQTRVKVGVAAACVAPLIKVLCADASDVGVVEYQTASLLLGELICLDPVQVRNHLNLARSNDRLHSCLTICLAHGTPPMGMGSGRSRDGAGRQGRSCVLSLGQRHQSHRCETARGADPRRRDDSSL